MAQIILDSNNNLIQGDFDNATLNNRTKLQTTTTNATTNVYVVPNGSSTSAGVSVANNSSLTNASKIVMATNGTTDTQIISGVNGSGTYLPLSFYTNNALAAQLTTAGNMTFGVADSGIVFNKTGALTNSTLNDYEVGTWTCTIGTTGTAFTNSGNTNPNCWYTKIGRFVQIWGAAISSGATSGGTGNVTINGLPFAIDTGFYGNLSAPGTVAWGRITLTTGYSVFVVGNTATQLLIQYNTSGANPTAVPASAFNGNSSPYVNFVFSYYATS
jgi:hypothetical protein